ncbi:MAG: Hsp20/alpha crystallin family protein [Ferruginibacter sp.]
MTLVKVNHPISKSIDGFVKDFMNEFPSTMSKTFREDVLHYPPVNIMETNEKYVLEMAAPGFEKSDFQIKLEEKLLTVSLDQKPASEASTDKIIRREFSSKGFKRSFNVDEKIDGDNISARYEKGILTLDLPKKEILKASAKEINVL